MVLFYVDESGSPFRHSQPLRSGGTPLFVLASLAFHAERWRDLDRAYLRLKTAFFAKEIGERRPELHEVKGSELVGPHNRTSRRRHSFARQVMELCIQHNASAFAVILKKDHASPTPAASMYTMALQYLVERFQRLLEENSQGLTQGFAREAARGLVIADSRMSNLDLNVAISHLSFIFGNPTGQQCTRVIEAPTFTFSQLSVGLQLTDIFASCLYARTYQRHCRDVLGALDYPHMSYFEDYGDRLEFRSRLEYGGYRVRGYRFIDLGSTGS